MLVSVSKPDGSGELAKTLLVSRIVVDPPGGYACELVADGFRVRLDGHELCGLLKVGAMAVGTGDGLPCPPGWVEHGGCLLDGRSNPRPALRKVPSQGPLRASDLSPPVAGRIGKGSPRGAS